MYNITRDQLQLWAFDEPQSLRVTGVATAHPHRQIMDFLDEGPTCTSNAETYPTV